MDGSAHIDGMPSASGFAMAMLYLMTEAEQNGWPVTAFIVALGLSALESEAGLMRPVGDMGSFGDAGDGDLTEGAVL